MNSPTRLIWSLGALSGLFLVSAQPTRTPPPPGVAIRRNFADVNRKLLEMAKDFPEDKYNFKLKPEMRSFGAVIVHVAAGNVWASKAGRGENANWEAEERDIKDYPTKAAVVAMFQKSIDDANATLAKWSDEQFTKTVNPWLPVIEHSAEHYGLLVAYYRANGLVPPDSRPRK